MGELPLSTQARLLRVLETGEYIRVGSSEVRRTNVRIVAATNVNIQHAIRDGRFREDLFYRLNTIHIKMPPLRDRGDDILLLFKKFAMEVAAKYQMPERISLTPEAEEVMKRYKWPGNIRQLKNITEQMSILMRETRIVTPAILAEYEIWPSATQEEALVRVGRNADDLHTYAQEREMLFQMISALHNEINELRQRINGGINGDEHAMMATQHKGSEPATMTMHPGGFAMPRSTIPMPKQPTMTVPADAYVSNSDNASADNTPYAEEYVEETLSIEEQEKRLIIRALERCRGRRKKAADELHISERTLYRKIKEYGLEDM